MRCGRKEWICNAGLRSMRDAVGASASASTLNTYCHHRLVDVVPLRRDVAVEVIRKQGTGLRRVPVANKRLPLAIEMMECLSALISLQIDAQNLTRLSCVTETSDDRNKSVQRNRCSRVNELRQEWSRRRRRILTPE